MTGEVRRFRPGQRHDADNFSWGHAALHPAVPPAHSPGVLAPPMFSARTALSSASAWTGKAAGTQAYPWCGDERSESLAQLEGSPRASPDLAPGNHSLFQELRLVETKNRSLNPVVDRRGGCRDWTAANRADYRAPPGRGWAGWRGSCPDQAGGVLQRAGIIFMTPGPGRGSVG